LGDLGLILEGQIGGTESLVQTGLCAVFSGLGLVQSWSFLVLVQSSLSLFPVLRLDFQELTMTLFGCSTKDAFSVFEDLYLLANSEKPHFTVVRKCGYAD